MYNNYKKALERAKQLVTSGGRSNVFAYVVEERDEDGREGFEVLNDATYQEIGNEDRCCAAVWSYPDGRYDDANVFHESGKIAAAVEEY